MSTRHTPCGDRGARGLRALSEDALRDEIVFWRDLIEASAEAQPPESVERMHQALALAECRLKRLQASRWGRAAKSLADDFGAPGDTSSRTSG